MLGHSAGQALVRGGMRPWYAGLKERVPARLFIFAGVVMFPLYIAMDAIASLAYEGYSYRDQAISELSAIGAPTRAGWIVAGVVWNVLALAFAIGVLARAGHGWRMRTIAWLVAAYAMLGPIWYLAPMHQREALAAGAGDWRDTMHLVLGGASSLLYFAMIGIAAFASRGWFRWYSLATIGLMVVFGTLMNIDMPKVSDNEATPWLGIYERLAVEGAMLWMAVLAGVWFWSKPARGGG